MITIIGYLDDLMQRNQWSFSMNLSEGFLRFSIFLMNRKISSENNEDVKDEQLKIYQDDLKMRFWRARYYAPFRLVQSKVYAYSKMTTHYDTLEISPEATKTEIKSAYYKLTMQYHPDKNDSELAKKRFQNISEAYEVLNNDHSRKRYDRSILVKRNIQESIPKNKYTYASTYNSKINPMGNKYFNFDEWTRQHYGETFNKRKSRHKFIKFNIKSSQKKYSHEIPLLLSTISIVVIYLIIKFSSRNDYDTPQKKD
ncbi:hypothetical protein M0802_005972 [Mischocyttarus mexicanus]|nr:hypothetical protein M0802_005972 [Mischocyttarus mexicanus]